MTDDRPARYCRCGTRLARDNRGKHCAACRARARRTLAEPPLVTSGFWDAEDIRDAIARRHMGQVVAAFRRHPSHPRPLRQDTVAGWLGITQAQLSRIENGPPPHDLDKLVRWAQVLGIPGRLLRFSLPDTAGLAASAESLRATADQEELAALDLLQRVSASDVGEEVLDRLETVTDDLAVAYPSTDSTELLARLGTHLGYVRSLLDGRTTLAQRQRLVVVGGWLSLLAATAHVDLDRPGAARAHLHTAASLARHAGHDELHAWCYETEAWRVLTDGDYRRAVDLSRAAQQLAPAGSSAAVQSAAQEGRAWARLGSPRETYAALDTVTRLVAPLQRSTQPEHHYRYDPDKSVAYVATTLAWIGDPAAETYAREIIARLRPHVSGRWPRRLAAANLDLALCLLGTGRLDEACDAALRAISSGRVVPSNHWRAAEVVGAVEERRLPEAADLREAYQDMRRRAAAPPTA